MLKKQREKENTHNTNTTFLTVKLYSEVLITYFIKVFCAHAEKVNVRENFVTVNGFPVAVKGYQVAVKGYREAIKSYQLSC